jgi:hypothetical protein
MPWPKGSGEDDRQIDTGYTYAASPFEQARHAKNRRLEPATEGRSHAGCHPGANPLPVDPQPAGDLQPSLEHPATVGLERKKRCEVDPLSILAQGVMRD